MTFIHQATKTSRLTELPPKFSADYSSTPPLMVQTSHMGLPKLWFDVVKRHSSHCKSSHFDLHPSLIQSFCDPLSVDNLRNLSMSNYPVAFNAQTPPNLTYLNLFSVQLQRVNVRCENLPHVSFRCIGVGGCIEVIRRAPLLEWGSFGHVLRSQLAITPTVYHRDNVRFLHIDSSCFEITRTLAVPALERLSYVFPGDDPIDEMISLIRRSSCQVKTLRGDYIAQPRDLVKLL